MERGRHTLLIVDDEPDVLESLRHLFHRRYRVLTASYGLEALRTLEREPVQIVLSDQRMPGMTGDELLHQVRERSPDAIRLLFTGYADIQAVINAVNQGGIFRYILKPWDSAELEATIGQAAAQYDLLAERRRLMDDLEAANRELTRVNQELAESDALKAAFLEVASHELNTPINIVQGMSELLKLLNPDRPEPERGIVEQLGETTRNLGRLVGTMLKLTQSKDFRIVLRRGAVELSPWLRDLAAGLEPILQARRLRLEADVSDDLGPFEIDADKMRDVVVNLLSNAIKFTPDGGSIALRGRLAAAEEAEIIVEDRGIGLEPKALARLFDPFFTEFDPSQHSSGDFGFGKRGLGLGLSLVKKFVEMHGGRVSAESAPGEGTRITIRLPRRGAGEGGPRDGRDGTIEGSPAGAVEAPPGGETQR